MSGGAGVIGQHNGSNPGVGGISPNGSGVQGTSTTSVD
jgi:hypothetical protein